jgi:hypothetical protein
VVIVEPLAQAMEQKLRDIFRGWIVLLKKGEVIQIVVIQFGQDISGGLFDFAEIHEHDLVSSGSTRTTSLSSCGYVDAFSREFQVSGSEIADDLTS